jgi:hypothetical protein
LEAIVFARDDVKTKLDDGESRARAVDPDQTARSASPDAAALIFLGATRLYNAK